MMENEESEVCENETNSALPSMGSKGPFSAHNDGAESLRSESDSNDCPDSNGIQSSIDNMNSDATFVSYPVLHYCVAPLLNTCRQ